MTHHLHNDPDLLRAALPRRRVLLSLLGGTLTLVGLAGCGGAEDDEEEEEGEEEEGQQNEEEEDD